MNSRLQNRGILNFCVEPLLDKAFKQCVAAGYSFATFGPIHPYILRRSGLYFRAALLLQDAGLTLRQCCLLWNWHATSIPLSASDEQEYYALTTAQKNAFFKTLDRIKVFSGITLDQNIIDYLLGAFSLFPQLQNIPPDYWLSPLNWEPQTLPKRLQLLKSNSSNYKGRRF